MLGSLIRRGVRLAIGGAAGYVAYKSWENSKPPQALKVKEAFKKPTVSDCLAAKIRAANMQLRNVDNSGWTGFDKSRLPELLFGREARWLPFTASGYDDRAYNESALKRANITSWDRRSFFHLMKAVVLRDLELIEQIVKKNPSVLRAEDVNGETALFYVSICSDGKTDGSRAKTDEAVIRLMVKLGADPTHRNHKGETFIDKLEQSGYAKLAGELCRNTGRTCHKSGYGADIRGPV